MRNYILINIKNGLSATIGQSSTVYTTTLVEELTNRIPEQVTVNYFTGIAISNVSSFDREIGKNYPVRKNYNCLIAVLVKSADFDGGQDEVDIIVNRISKYFALDSGSLKGSTLTRDGVKETVSDYLITNIQYGEAGDLKVGQLGNACLINLSIMVDIII
jgi:hypothetical protein